MLNLYSYFEGVDDEIKARGLREHQEQKNKVFEEHFPVFQSDNAVKLAKNTIDIEKQRESLANFYLNSDLRTQNDKLLRETDAYNQAVGFGDIAARQSVLDKTSEANAKKIATAAVTGNINADAAIETVSIMNDPETRSRIARMAATDPNSAVAYLQKQGYKVSRTADGLGFIFNGSPYAMEDFALLMNDAISFSTGRSKAAEARVLAETKSQFVNGETTTPTSTPLAITQSVLGAGAAPSTTARPAAPTSATAPATPKSTVANTQAAIAVIEKEIAATNASQEYTPERKANYLGKLNADLAKLKGQTAPVANTQSLPVSAVVAPPPVAAPQPIPKATAVAQQLPKESVLAIDSWIKPEHKAMASEIQIAKNELVKAAQSGNTAQQISAAQKVQKLINVLDFSLAGMQEGLAQNIKTRLGL